MSDMVIVSLSPGTLKRPGRGTHRASLLGVGEAVWLEGGRERFLTSFSAVNIEAAAFGFDSSSIENSLSHRSPAVVLASRHALAVLAIPMKEGQDGDPVDDRAEARDDHAEAEEDSGGPLEPVTISGVDHREDERAERQHPRHPKTPVEYPPSG
jgi:hypothetical protein